MFQPLKPKQVYSRHFLRQQTPAAAEETPPSVSEVSEVLEAEARPTSRKRSLLGALGVMSLVGVIWGVAELWQPTVKVDAQEGQAPVEEVAAPETPWESASFPVEEFLAYTSPFGYRNHPFGGRRFHYGLDIAAPMGSYIRAWWEGTVVEVSDDTACGTSVVIESHGWLHIYCHMQGYVVVEADDGDRWMVDHDGGVKIRQGDLVKSGQRIGRIGMTGRTTGPHLHWGMKFQGNWVDPSVILKAMVES